MKNSQALTICLGKQLSHMLALQLYNNNEIQVKYVKHFL